jgi:hypothetical protein
VTIHINGVDELIRKLDSIAKLREIGQVMRAAALHVKGKIDKYPPERHGSAIPSTDKWSDKQRRGFFAKLRSGEIEVPYRRGSSPGSKKLKTKWTTTLENGGLRAVVGNDTSYAPLVQGPGTQTAYHAMTGWQTTEQVMDAERETVQEMVREGIQKIIND